MGAPSPAACYSVPMGCVRSTLWALLLGGSWVAYAQDPIAAPVPTAAYTTDLAALLQGGGFPAALAYGAWVLSRALATWTPTIRVIVDQDPPE